MPKYFYFKDGEVIYITAKSLIEAKAHSKYVGRSERLFEEEYRFDYWLRKNDIWYDEANSESDIFFAYKSKKQRWHHFYSNKLDVPSYPHEDAIQVQKGVSFDTIYKKYFDFIAKHNPEIKDPYDLYKALVLRPIVIETKLK